MNSRPRRSVLFMPGSNSRAMEKAKGLDADTLIFDLEDAVAPERKEQAREMIVEALAGGGYGYREVAVRINTIESALGQADLEAMVKTTADAIVMPKVESVEQVQQALVH